MTKKNGSSGQATQAVAMAVNQGAAVAAGASAAPPSLTPSGPGDAGTGGATAAPILSARAAGGLRAKLQLMLAGVQSMIPDGASLGAVNAPIKKSDAVAELTANLAEYSGVDVAASTASKARLQLRDDLPAMRAYYAALATGVKQLFGDTSPDLVHFGLKPKTAQKLTPAQLLARTERARQTRTIRGTISKKEKAQLKFQGQVAVSAQAVEATPRASGAGTTAQAAAPAAQPTPVAAPAGAAPTPGK